VWLKNSFDIQTVNLLHLISTLKGFLMKEKEIIKPV
jgi:hypothetical protein